VLTGAALMSGAAFASGFEPAIATDAQPKLKIATRMIPSRKNGLILLIPTGKQERGPSRQTPERAAAGPSRD